MFPITHINVHRAGRPVIVTTSLDRLEAVRRIQLVGARHGVVGCAVQPDHIHVVALCPADEAGALAQAIESSLTQTLRLKPGFVPYFCKEVADQNHFDSAMRYLYRQGPHHDDDRDRYHDGSNGPELLGGRLLRGSRGLFVPPARDLFKRFVTRVGDSEIERLLLGRGSLLPLAKLGAAPGGLAGEPLEALLVLAAAATVSRVNLDSSAPFVTEVRAALLRTVEASPFAASVDPARMLGCSTRTLRRLRSYSSAPEVEDAVQWQVRFRLSHLELELRARLVRPR